MDYRQFETFVDERGKKPADALNAYPVSPAPSAIARATLQMHAHRSFLMGREHVWPLCWLFREQVQTRRATALELCLQALEHRLKAELQRALCDSCAQRQKSWNF